MCTPCTYIPVLHVLQHVYRTAVHRVDMGTSTSVHVPTTVDQKHTFLDFVCVVHVVQCEHTPISYSFTNLCSMAL